MDLCPNFVSVTESGLGLQKQADDMMHRSMHDDDDHDKHVQICLATLQQSFRGAHTEPTEQITLAKQGPNYTAVFKTH